MLTSIRHVWDFFYCHACVCQQCKNGFISLGGGGSWSLEGPPLWRLMLMVGGGEGGGLETFMAPWRLRAELRNDVFTEKRVMCNHQGAECVWVCAF